MASSFEDMKTCAIVDDLYVGGTYYEKLSDH
jgi:hypothetical protein